ncbi:signal transduction histidine kinase [Anaerosolibacter carboniphilus]|uniref:histidine kinase n=1 Tax=Anaerosolibacter carboniphilus TaxID=1417629 RepID=A0A841KY95_9FIRM|nr:HAMP domain-containing sensor histidine kinase [Anaerosolibacter carboniphilus]MBB6217278.1 signal transduction histidine kinase [Anaerosolibacter carboniphilus]
MMYAIVSIIVFGIFIMVKEKGTTRYFLFLMILGWVASILGFTSYLLYLQKRELYLFMFAKVFSPTLILWGNLDFLQMDVISAISQMSFGTLCFIYACLCFSISLTNLNRYGYKLYLALAILPVLEFIIYNPYTYSAFYNWYFMGKSLSSPDFQVLLNLEPKIYNITLAINYIYLIVSIVIIIYYYIKTPAMKYFNTYILTILVGFSTNIITFATVFWWAPKRLISVSVFTGYTHVLPVSLFWEGKILFIFPYISFISCITLLAALFKYNNDHLIMKQTSRLIVKGFDTAGLGTRMISHNFKNYIMATILDAEFLKEKYEDDPESLEYINRILTLNHEFMESLNYLNDKFKTLSLYIQPFDLKLVLKSALKKHNLSAIKIDIQEPPEAVLTLIDPNQMTEVLCNIIKNAVEAMQYTDKNLSIQLFIQKKWSIITISDSGCGMNSEQIDRLFIPFYSTKSSIKNWGVGLNYCYKIIHSHKGKIIVNSKPGLGTSFRILLPRA